MRSRSALIDSELQWRIQQFSWRGYKVSLAIEQQQQQ